MRCTLTPAVAEAAVYGVSDPFLGEEVWANVVLKPSVSVDAQELEAVCRRSLAAYKVPTAFVLVDALPQQPHGQDPEARVARPPPGRWLRTPARRERGSELDSSRLESWVRDWLGRHLNLSPRGH